MKTNKGCLHVVRALAGFVLKLQPSPVLRKVCTLQIDTVTTVFSAFRESIIIGADSNFKVVLLGGGGSQAERTRLEPEVGCWCRFLAAASVRSPEHHGRIRTGHQKNTIGGGVFHEFNIVVWVFIRLRCDCFPN